MPVRRVLPIALLLLPAVARAEGLLDGVGGSWAVGSTAACARSAYEWTVQPAPDGAGGEPVVSFRDRAGRLNQERVESRRPDGFTTATVLSPDVPAGTRWDYAATVAGTFAVRNLSSGRRFVLVRCPAAAAAATTAQRPAQPIAQPLAETSAQPLAAKPAAPTFPDSVALVTWLIGSSGTEGGAGGRRFDYSDDAASANVFSPGLRAALRAAFLRSRERNEPPCGADGDIVLDTQEQGIVRNLRLSAQPGSAPDRVAVAASYDVDGHHRERRYMTVNLDGTWKLENIVEANGSSLRRSLECRR